MFATNNKGVGIVVEIHYDPKTDFGSIFEKNTHCEDNLDYAQRELVSFPNNRKEEYSWKTKKKRRLFADQIFFSRGN